MSKELKQYLDLLEKEQEQEQSEDKPKPSKQDYDDQNKKFQKSQHKQSLIEKTVYNVDRDGLPKTRKGQGNTEGGLGKEVPTFVSDPRLSRKRPNYDRKQRRDD